MTDRWSSFCKAVQVVETMSFRSNSASSNNLDVVLSALQVPTTDTSSYAEIRVPRTLPFDSVFPLKNEDNGFEYADLLGLSKDDVIQAWETSHASVILSRLRDFVNEFPDWYQKRYLDARSGQECKIAKGNFRHIESVEMANAKTESETICYSCPKKPFPEDITIGDILEVDCVENLPFGITSDAWASLPESFQQQLTRNKQTSAPPQFWTHTSPLWLYKGPGIISNVRLEVRVPKDTPCLIQDVYMQALRTDDGKIKLFKTIAFGACSMKVTKIDYVKSFILNPHATKGDVKCITCEMLVQPI